MGHTYVSGIFCLNHIFIIAHVMVLDIEQFVQYHKSQHYRQYDLQYIMGKQIILHIKTDYIRLLQCLSSL